MSIFKIFQELRNQSPVDGDRFAVASLPIIKNHKIGISVDKQPMFFIKCDPSGKQKLLDINLEYISIQYGRQCELITIKNKEQEGLYTIISLKTDSEYLQEYFLKIVFMLIKNISEQPILTELKIEIEKLINLFDRFSKPAINTIQGLWAELLIIEQSRDPDYLLRAWHSSISDKFDFNDGIDKVEVKSTSKNRRIHNFSLEQLTPNSNSKLVIVSIHTTETGIGVTVYDLIKSIEIKINDKNLGFRINEIVAATLGNELEKAFDIFFDYQYAIDTIKYFNSEKIPTINREFIPLNLLNVRFDCDLSDIETIDKTYIQSKLHNSLF